MTAKHRVFVSMDHTVLPDQGLIVFAVDDLSVLAVVSSRVHVAWSLAAGGRLGIGNDSRYNNSRCFETFPFPELNEPQTEAIGNFAKKLDTHRKRQQAEHPKLKLTDMYNVLEKLRAEEPLTDKEKAVHQQGLVSILKELHDELDRAVFDAYGWNDLADKLIGLPGATTPLTDKPKEQAEAEEELLTRLVALNHQRAAEEVKGHIRWLRPEYQAPESVQADINLEDHQAPMMEVVKTISQKLAWPKELREQIKVLLEQLHTGPATAPELAERFKRKPLKAVTQVLSALEALSRANQENDTWSLGSKISESVAP
ncbi:Thymidylate kinase [gamma proteobacterium IMCC2047]|nr:Thymidylate kinase [gamma proteobacterium IMCC2047]